MIDNFVKKGCELKEDLSFLLTGTKKVVPESGKHRNGAMDVVVHANRKTLPITRGARESFAGSRFSLKLIGVYTQGAN